MTTGSFLESKVDFENKKILLVSPHPDDDVIGCGALILELKKLNTKLTIAYGTSGFNGVTDAFLKTKGLDNTREAKTQTREKEATAFCKSVSAKPVFWKLPFYEERKKEISNKDVDITTKTINEIKPDIIILADQDGDPHGTHGLVKESVTKALEKSDFDGEILLYKVWSYFDDPSSCEVKIFFNEEEVSKKEELIRLYESQVIDPAFPSKDGSFIEISRTMCKNNSKSCNSKHKYCECYKISK